MAPSATPSLVELSEIISSRTKIVDDFLKTNDLPQPSFDADGPFPDYLPYDHLAVLTARRELVEASKLMSELAVGAKSHLFALSTFGHHESNTLRIIYAYQIAKHVPPSGTISYADLSKACGLDEDRLCRILRHATLMHVFSEPVEGKVAHSVLSKPLATDENAVDWIGHNLEDVFPAAEAQVTAMKKWPGAKEANQCGFAHVSGDKGAFQVFGEEPERARRFAGAMQYLSGEGGISDARQTAILYDWKSLGKATLVDVGGSRGFASAAIAATAPEMRFVVQDLPEVISQVEGPPPGCEGRFEYQVHDFFKPQPVTDADVYFLRYIMHDWSTEKCIEILKNLVPSMKQGSRLIISDWILNPPGQGEPSLNKWARIHDHQMMVALNSRERTLGEWEDLVSKGCDGKLKLETTSSRLLVYIMQ